MQHFGVSDVAVICESDLMGKQSSVPAQGGNLADIGGSGSLVYPQTLLPPHMSAPMEDCTRDSVDASHCYVWVKGSGQKVRRPQPHSLRANRAEDLYHEPTAHARRCQA